MARQKIQDMKAAKVYSLLLQKVEKKGRTKAELDQVIQWLTGWQMTQVNPDLSYGDFIDNAPVWNPSSEKIRGSICGVKIENIEDPWTKRMRQLDKLVDELARGKPMEKVLR